MSTPAEKANLARIRDNQRRSRARRKEYLQEIEQRLRQVELQGVEASAEIQVAARKVAEENKKLRALLNRHGVNDDSIEAFLASGVVAPPGSGAAAAQFRAPAPGKGVQGLEQLLGPRRPTCVDPGTPLIPMPPGGGHGSRETSVTSISSVWDVTQNAASPHGRSLSGPMPGQQPRMTQQQQQQQQQHQQQQQAAGSVGRGDVSMRLQGLPPMIGDHASRLNANASRVNGDAQNRHAYKYDMQFLQNPSAYNPAQQQRHSLSNQSFSSSAGVSTYMESATVTNDVMSSMTAMEPQNVTFNTALGRYTATSIGM